MPRHVRSLFALWLLGAGGLAACGDGGGGQCAGNRDEVPALVAEDAALETFWIGDVGVQARRVVGAGAEEDILVQAHFTDFLEYRIILADRHPYSAACEVYLGRPMNVKRCRQQTCDPDSDPCPAGFDCHGGECVPRWQTCAGDADCPATQACEAGLCLSPVCPEDGECPVGLACQDSQAFPLGVDAVTVTGVAAAPVVLTPPEAATDTVPGIDFAAATIGVTVDSGGGARDFPAFTAELPAPALPELTRFGEINAPNLAEGPRLGLTYERTAPFWVQWTAGDGDYMVFSLTPGDGSETPWGKLRCITFDDGCLEVPGAALGQLALDTATNFRLKLERHQVTTWSQQTGGQTTAAAIVDVSAVLQGTVGR